MNDEKKKNMPVGLVRVTEAERPDAEGDAAMRNLAALAGIPLYLVEIVRPKRRKAV